MNTGWIRGLLILGCLLFWSGGARAESITWAKSFDAAMKQAKATGRPVMVDFYTDWCGYCKKLDAEVYTDAQVIRAAGKFISVKMNAEKEGYTQARQYQVTGFPTILFLDAQGGVVGTVRGYAPAPVFMAAMQDALNTHREMPVLRARFKSSPTDAATAAKLAAAYAKQRNKSGAVIAYERVRKLDPNGAKGYLPAAAAALGDMYQAQREYTASVPYYRIATRYGKTAPILRKGRVGQTVSLLMADRVTEAKASLKEMIADRRLTDQDRAEARAMLGRVEALQKEGKLQGG
jgi:thiol-disulfide isomerase/thioredoxin